jgi:elongation factor Ts
MLHCKFALERTRGDVDQAVESLRLQGIANAETRVVRQTSEGRIASYIHHNGRLGAIVELNCETDFVARTDDFAILATQLAEHVAAAAPIAVSREGIAPEAIAEKALAFETEVRAAGKPESLVARIVDGKLAAYFELVVLLEQRWVREPKVKIGDLINELAARTGENIQIRRFSRFHMGTA